LQKIHGSAFGGGVGLIACCDIGIMNSEATLSLSELKLGLIPSTIAPFFQRKIGVAQSEVLRTCIQKNSSWRMQTNRFDSGYR
jgi:methylglutaconyl-CoA hydratase